MVDSNPIQQWVPQQIRDDVTCVRDSNIISYSLRYPLLYRIRIGHSPPANSVVELVKTSALVSRRSWVRIPPENAYYFFHLRGSGKQGAYSAYKIYVGKGKIPNLDLLYWLGMTGVNRSQPNVYTRCTLSGQSVAELPQHMGIQTELLSAQESNTLQMDMVMFGYVTVTVGHCCVRNHSNF